MELAIASLNDVEPNLVHVVLGTPDDGCPICRAHPGGVILKAQLTTCPCEMCVDFRLIMGIEALKAGWGGR